MRVQLYGKRLYPIESVKYLAVNIDTNLSLQNQVNDLTIKLNRVNALLSKTRKYFGLKILTLTCPTTVLSGLRIVALFNELLFYKKKAIRTINFQPGNFHTSPLFKQNYILKFQDKISLENILFFSESLNNLSPSVFNT